MSDGSAVNLTQQKVLHPWQHLLANGNTLTQKREGHTAVAWGGAVWVWGGGGGDGGSIDVLDTARNTWTTLRATAPHPPLLRGHTATVHGGCMHVFGGQLADGSCSATLYVYSFATNAWDAVAAAAAAACSGEGELPPPAAATAAPAARCGHCAVLVPEHAALVVVGGQGAHGEVFDDAWAFSLQLRRWLPLTDAAPQRLPARTRAAAVYDSGVVYLQGGLSDSGACCGDLLLIRVDLSSGVLTWDVHRGESFAPPPRYGHTADAFNGRMYVYGGTSTDGALQDWHRFSFRYSLWVRLQPSGHAATARAGHASCTTDTHLYILGGSRRTRMRRRKRRRRWRKRGRVWWARCLRRSRRGFLVLCATIATVRRTGVGGKEKKTPAGEQKKCATLSQ
eukprot:Rhum_TRINITY_DN14116_c5_g1::Rhum_TRINITY_DN14116_c5_g1_i1::g.70049::m.70049